MQNIGEEIVGEYLKYCEACQFIQYNLSTPDIQGEIDVVGLNLADKRLYVCEVAIHLETGLQYVDNKNNKPANVERLTKKFAKDVEYARKYFPDFTPIAMFWCPVVRNQSGKKAIHNQMRDIQAIHDAIERTHHIQVDMVVNERFQEYLVRLREVAAQITEECKSPVMRLLQIEEKLARHLRRMKMRSSHDN